MKYFFATIALIFSTAFYSYAQINTDSTQAVELAARNALEKELNDTTLHNVINSKTFLLKNKERAIDVAEVILFYVYGKDNIVKQRPYNCSLIDKYWVISGSLLAGYYGGVFHIVIDATNARVMRLTHGK